MDDSILDSILSENDSITGFGNTELLRQQDRLARRRAMLEADAMASAKQIGLYQQPSGPIQIPSFRSSVVEHGGEIVGPAVKRPLLASLTPLIGDTARGFQEDKLDKDTSGYNRLQHAIAARVMREMPTSGDAPGPYGVNVPTQPTQQQMLAWASRAAQIPSLAPMAKAFMEEAVKLPAQQAAQLWERYKFAAQQKLEQDKFEYEKNKPFSVSQVGLFERDPNSPTGYKKVPDTSPTGTLQPVTNPLTGDVSAFNNRTGSTTPSPGGAGAGQRSDKVVTQELDATTKKTNAKEALRLLDGIEPTIKAATGSLLGAARDYVASGPGYATEGAKNLADLQVVASRLLAFADKSGLGPQFSDADRKFLMGGAAGGIDDPKTPAEVKLRAVARIKSNLMVAAGINPQAAASTQQATQQDAASKAKTLDAAKARLNEAKKAHITYGTPQTKRALQEAQDDVVRAQSDTPYDHGHPAASSKGGFRVIEVK